MAEVTIKTKDCEIYNFQTNTWINELNIGNLLSEQKKIYHIRSKTPEISTITVLGRTIVKTRPFQILNEEIEEQLSVSSTAELYFNLATYMFRQRTQELLYEVRTNVRPVDDVYCKENKIINNKLINKLSAFRQLMLTYMQHNHMTTDSIMKMLCDDMYICVRTIGTEQGMMFACARQTSQGRQQTYTCSAVDEPKQSHYLSTTMPYVGMCPPLSRQVGTGAHLLSSNDEIIDDNIGLLSQDILSPYSSNGVVNVMRSISGRVSI